MKKKVFNVSISVLEEVREAIVGHLLRSKYTAAYILESYPSDDVSYNLVSVYYTSALLYKTELDRILQFSEKKSKGSIELPEEVLSKINQYKNKITVYINEINLDPRYNLTVQ